VISLIVCSMGSTCRFPVLFCPLHHVNLSRFDKKYITLIDKIFGIRSVVFGCGVIVYSCEIN
jgi:hypothetical protein